MIVRKHEKVMIQGITGKQGTFWTERMQEYGTNIVGGIVPKKGGQDHLGVPVFNNAFDAMKDVPFDVAGLFVPPLYAKSGAVDAIEAGVKKLVVLTEHIPVQDVMYFMAAAKEHGTTVIGPNTAGSATIDECFLGFMPVFNDRIFKKGNVGVMSRSGSLATLMCQNIVSAGYGQTAFLGIGGDPVLGTTTRDAIEALDNFEGTEVIVMVGEIGGSMEEDAAEYVATMDKPVVAFIAGGAAPPGKKMGHAGAIVMGDKGTYKSKADALSAAGVAILDTPMEIMTRNVKETRSWIQSTYDESMFYLRDSYNKLRAIMTVHVDDLGVTCRMVHRPHLGRIQPKRLFAHDVLAVRCGGERHFAMGEIRRGDDHRVDVGPALARHLERVRCRFAQHSGH